MSPWVEITFNCVPLRAVVWQDPPPEASPKWVARYGQLVAARDKHGLLNSFYLHTGRCLFHLLNHEQEGLLEFGFEGTVLTDENDQQTTGSDLIIELTRESCDWLTSPVVQWFQQTVDRAVRCEFDRYIAQGDLQKTLDRVQKLQAETEAAGGYVGMYL